MGRFAFKGSHGSESKVVSGVVEAATRDEALAQLAKRAIKVTHLDALPDSGKLGPPPTGSGRLSLPATSPAPPSGKLTQPKALAPHPTELTGRAPPLHQQDSLPRKGLALATLLMGLGFVYLLAGAGATPSGASNKVTLRVKVFGRLQLPPEVSPAQVQAQVHLPEIPLDEFRGGQDFLDDKGNFCIEIPLQTQIQPNHLAFTARVGANTKVELQNLHLTRQPDGVMACDLSLLKLSSHQSPPPPRPLPSVPARLARSTRAQPPTRVQGPHPDLDGSSQRRWGSP